MPPPSGLCDLHLLSPPCLHPQVCVICTCCHPHASTLRSVWSAPVVTPMPPPSGLCDLHLLSPPGLHPQVCMICTRWHPHASTLRSVWSAPVVTPMPPPSGLCDLHLFSPHVCTLSFVWQAPLVTAIPLSSPFRRIPGFTPLHEPAIIYNRCITWVQTMYQQLHTNWTIVSYLQHMVR
jgi:hypothetical protein